MRFINVHRTCTLAIAVTLATVVLTSHAAAQPGRSGGEGLAGLEALDLSDEQLGRIQDIRSQARASAEPLSEQRRDTRDELRDVMRSEVVNEGAIRALVAAAADVEANLVILRAYANADILAVLTPDQRARLEEIRAEREDEIAGRLEERRQRRRSR